MASRKRNLPKKNLILQRKIRSFIEFHLRLFWYSFALNAMPFDRGHHPANHGHLSRPKKLSVVQRPILRVNKMLKSAAQHIRSMFAKFLFRVFSFRSIIFYKYVFILIPKVNGFDCNFAFNHTFNINDLHLRELKWEI